jgi:hypothetical protein
MRRSAVVISFVFAVVCSLVAPAAATGSAPRRGDLPPELAAMIADALRGLGAPDHAVDAALDAETRDNPYLHPVGDLDGDGGGDVVSVAYRDVEDDPAATELVLTARRGRDGQTLWTHTRDGGLNTIIPAQVGGGDGLLLFNVMATTWGVGVGGLQKGEDPHGGWTDFGVDVRVDITALSLTGQVLWNRELGPGHYYYAPRQARVVSNLVFPVGVLDATGTSADDILTATYNRQPSQNGQQDTLKVGVIDGADGRDVSSSAAVSVAGMVTSVQPTADLSGDGRDDYLIYGAHDDATTGATLKGMSGANHQQLWSSAQAHRPAFFVSTTSVGDANGDGTPDLTLSGDTDKIDIVDGASGAKLSTVRGNGVVRLGDITGDGKTEVGTLLIESDKARVTVSAFRPGGAPVYTTAYAVPTKVSNSANAWFLGDVDRDGVRDIGFQVAAVAGDAQSSNNDQGVISGRTGERINSKLVPAVERNGSVDGDGADSVVVTPWGSTSRDVTAVDGLTGKDLWTGRVRPRGETATFSRVALDDLTGDGHSEAIVTVSSETVRSDIRVGVVDHDLFVDSYVLSGRDGAILWQTDPSPVSTPPARKATITPSTGYTWNGDPAVGAQGFSIDSKPCSADNPFNRCDLTLLTFDNPPASGATTRKAQGTVKLSDFADTSTPENLTDLDLYVYDSDKNGTRGALLGESAGSTEALTETVKWTVETTTKDPVRYVLVEVVYYQSANKGYRATASLDN